MERASIEKTDFPVGRRGYDPAAVDAHLRAVADHVDELVRAAARRPPRETLSSSASEQVKAIIEAAEKSASDIQKRVEDEAGRIRADARREARKERSEATAAATQEREQAAAEARSYVGKISDATSALLKRIDAIDSEFTKLTDTLRAGAERMHDELTLLDSELKELSGPSQPPAPEPMPAEPEPEPARREPEIRLDPEPADEPLHEADDEPLEEDEPATAVVGAGDDSEGARLIALNMALNGTPRDETDRYLAENFDLSDRGRLLDEVYASVEG